VLSDTQVFTTDRGHARLVGSAPGSMTVLLHGYAPSSLSAEYFRAVASPVVSSAAARHVAVAVDFLEPGNSGALLGPGELSR